MYTSLFRRNKELFTILKKTENKVCLDFGSGSGTHAIALLENNNTVDLLDIEGPLLNFAKKRIRKRGFSYKECFNNSKELPKNNYDLVVCADVLEHCFDPALELSLIKESLKINGLLALEVSEMVKPSSGHFGRSIDIWNKQGKKILAEHFKLVKANLYQKN